MSFYNQMVSAELERKLNGYLSEAKREGIQKICVGVGIWKEGQLMMVRRLADDFLGVIGNCPEEESTLMKIRLNR